MLSQKPKLTEAEQKFIKRIQDDLIIMMRYASKHLSEEEVAYILKQSFDQERVRLIVNFL